jgi:hypothetical protein
LARFAAEARWRALAEPRALIAAGLFGLVLVWGASQLNKNLYEAAHVQPTLAILVML